MKLRDGLLLIVLVLLVVILAYLISGKNPKKGGFLAPIIYPIRTWFGGVRGNGGNTHITVVGGAGGGGGVQAHCCVLLRLLP